MFLQVSVILSTVGGGVRGWRGVWLLGGLGHVWLWGVHGCQEACVVAGVCAWLQGGPAWLPGGACVVGGACMVARGPASLPGGMHGCWGACMVARGHVWLAGACIGYDEIWSMSGQYASYTNAFLMIWSCSNNIRVFNVCKRFIYP